MINRAGFVAMAAAMLFTACSAPASAPPVATVAAPAAAQAVPAASVAQGKPVFVDFYADW